MSKTQQLIHYTLPTPSPFPAPVQLNAPIHTGTPKAAPAPAKQEYTSTVAAPAHPPAYNPAEHVQNALLNPPKMNGTAHPMLCWVVPANPAGIPTHTPTPEPAPAPAPAPGPAQPLAKKTLMIGDSQTGKRNPVNELEKEVAELRRKLERLEPLNNRIAALSAAHLNASRHACGVTLLPVLPTGHSPVGLPPLSSAKAIEELSAKEAQAWVGYYVGKWASIGLEKEAAVKALRAAVGLPA